LNCIWPIEAHFTQRKIKHVDHSTCFVRHARRGRREYIWQEIQPLIDFLEAQDRSPGVQPIAEALVNFDSQHVHDAWQKALDRRVSDPEGAITAATNVAGECLQTHTG
jgi:hypothetical protein